MENIDDQKLNRETNAFLDDTSKNIAQHIWDSKPIDFSILMSRLEISILIILFKLCHGNKTVLSKFLKIPRTTLTHKLKVPNAEITQTQL